MTSDSLTLLASLAPGAPAGASDREREGILVPWDQPGRANVGPFGVPGAHGLMVRRDLAATLSPDAKVVGIYGHRLPGVEPLAVSRIVALENRPEGLWGRLRVARTALGDQLLAEIDDGARDGLSVEVSALEFDDAGHVTGGQLDYVAHVAVGAYSSARLNARAATVNHPSNGAHVTDPAAQPASLAAQPAPAGPVLQANLAPAPAAPAAPAPDGLAMLLAALQPAAPSADDVRAMLLAALQPASAPAAPSAAAVLGTSGVPAAPGSTPATDPIREAAVLQAGLVNSPGNGTLFAALADITHSQLPMFQGPSGAIGEKLWEGASYTRQWTRLMRSRPLTSMRGTSWQWTQRPQVAAWAGDKAEVPSGPVGLEEVPWTARRCAGGWDVDRAYRDFGTPEFWEEFYAAQTESYLELSDTWAAEALISYARDVSVDGNVPASYVPIDRTVDAGPTQVLKAAALGTAILEDTPRVKTGPDWIAMNTADWLTMADLSALDLPAFLALLKVNPANFMRTSLVPKGRVIMGVTQATTFRELGNGAPIRVEALDIARGGIDSAVYGYCSYSHDRPGGVIAVPLAAPAP